MKEDRARDRFASHSAVCTVPFRFVAHFGGGFKTRDVAPSLHCNWPIQEQICGCTSLVPLLSTTRPRVWVGSSAKPFGKRRLRPGLDWMRPFVAHDVSITPCPETRAYS